MTGYSGEAARPRPSTENPRPRTASVGRTSPRSGPRLTTVHAGLAAISGVIAWEWAISASHKITSDFVGEFPLFVRSSIGSSRPGVFTDLVSSVVLAAPTFSAIATIVLETLLAAIFMIAAVGLCLARRRAIRLLLAATLGASVLSFLFALILAVINGDAPPWQLRGNGFQSGIAVEYLLAGVSLAAIVAAAAGLHRAASDSPLPEGPAGTAGDPWA